MRQHALLQKYSKFAFFTGVLMLLLILFLQPLEPLHFIEAAFYSSSSTSLSISLYTFVVPTFWCAIFIAAFGLVGIVFSMRKRNLDNTKPKERSGQYDSADESEENWIFI